MLSIWMNGSTGIMISTPQLLEELKTDIFRKQSRKKYKREQFELVNMAAVITLGLGHLKGEFEALIEHFQVKPFLMSFIENS